MKKCILQILLLIALPAGSELQARQTGTPVHGEKVVLFSDRNMYIAGEQLLFSAFLFTGDEETDTLSSKVLYCELITPRGIRVAGDKFLIEDSCLAGNLSIPDDLMTGTYFLRAYTKYMRNYGPYSYSYTAVKVINPYRNEVQERIPGRELPEWNRDINYNDNSVEAIRISTDKPRYLQRDTVEILIETDPSFKSSLRGLTLAVVPEATVQGGVIEFHGNDQTESGQLYFTENRGISVTGKLTDTVTGQPVSYSRVSLSILGKGKDFMAVQTDSAGRFFFQMPDYRGKRDLFISCEKAAGPDVSILVDNDFCSAPVTIASDDFELSSEERKIAYRMAVNLQLCSLFDADSIVPDQDNHIEKQAFYGTPDDILFIDNYIELPTLEEYFNGLPNLVRVRKSNGQKYFKVLGNQAGLNSFDPLVLIDLVAVDDPLRILALKPSDISRIEVVNKLYIKGDETFGGVVSIISRHGDFAGINLPESGIFISYGFLSGHNYQISSVPPARNLPDTRNTLLWDPCLMQGSDNAVKIKLTASDMTGGYLIILNGVNKKGERIMKSEKIEVIR